MKVDIRTISGHLASMAWVALRTFVVTFAGLTLAGCVLAGASYYFLREQRWTYGVLAVVLALVEAVTIGYFLGAKRAIVMAVAHALGKLRLGGSFVGSVFERMLGVAEGKQGGMITRSLERLPLAQAEELLSSGVRSVTGDVKAAGWLRRKLQARLLEVVRKYTLARFREEGAKHGGIDLLKMKQELEQTVDDAIIKRVRSGFRLWTVLAVIGLPVVVALQTWGILMVASRN